MGPRRVFEEFRRVRALDPTLSATFVQASSQCGAFGIDTWTTNDLIFADDFEAGNTAAWSSTRL